MEVETVVPAHAEALEALHAARRFDDRRGEFLPEAVVGVAAGDDRRGADRQSSHRF